MSDTTQKAIPHCDVFRFHEGDSATFLDHQAVARVNVACGAIQTLTAVLMQREVDAECMSNPTLTMSGQVATGLMEALACCAELIHTTVNVIDHRAIGVTAVPFDSEGAELIRGAADRATLLRSESLRKGGA